MNNKYKVGDLVLIEGLDKSFRALGKVVPSLFTYSDLTLVRLTEIMSDSGTRIGNMLKYDTWWPDECVMDVNTNELDNIEDIL